MFIILLSYKKTLPEVDKHLPGHNEYLQKHYSSGNFICSGPRVPRTGGVILCNADSIASAHAIARTDPFVTNNVADYEIIEFIPVDYSSAFAPFIKVNSVGRVNVNTNAGHCPLSHLLCSFSDCNNTNKNPPPVIYSGAGCI